MASKLSIVKLNEIELSLIIQSIEQITVKGRDAIIVAGALKKLDRAKEKNMEGQPRADEMIPLQQLQKGNGVPMQEVK